MNADSYTEIAQLLARYCHIVDEAAWERLGEIFTDDGSMTVAGIHDAHRGLGELRVLYAEKMKHPLAHHSTSVVLLDGDEVRASVVSKWITVRLDGGAGTGVYRDELVRIDGAWRILTRVATPGRQPRV